MSPASIVRRTDLGRGTIFDTLPLLSGKMEANRDYRVRIAGIGAGI